MRILILFLFSLSSLTSYLPAKKNPAKEAQKSMDYMAYEEAVRYFQQAIFSKPDKKDIRVKQAFAFFRLGKYEKAIRALNEERALFPENFNAFILLGYVYFNQGKLEEAAATSQDFNTVFEKTVKEEALKKYGKYALDDKKEHIEKIRGKIRKKISNFALPYFILGFYHKKHRNFDKAKDYLLKAIQGGFNPIDCYLQLADIELIQEDWQEGLIILAKAQQEEGVQAELCYLMGYAYYYQGDNENAVLNMKKAVELKPYLLGAIKNLAKIYYNQKEFEKAVPLLRKALKIVPFDYEAKFLLEDAQRKKPIRGEEFKPKITKDIVDEVELEYKYIFTANIGEIMSVVNEYALTLVRSGQFNKAVNWIRRFLELYDRSPTLNYNLAKLYNIQNMHGESLKYAWKAKTLDKDFRDTYDLIGNIFFKMQDFENSLHYYSEAVRINPNDALGYYNLGLVYSEKNNFDKAEKNWRQAIQKEKWIKKREKQVKSSKDELNVSLIVQKRPVSFEAHKSLGFLYIKKNMIGDAVKEFKMAIELEPADPEPYYEVGKILYEQKNIREAAFYFEKYLYLGGKEEKIKEFKEKLGSRSPKEKKKRI